MKRSLFAIALIVMVLAAGCSQSSEGSSSSSSPSDEASASSDPIVIGYSGGFSGATASFGTPIFEAVKYAVEEVNATGGIMGRPLEMVEEDNEGDPFKGQQIIEKFTSEDIQFVLSGSSSAVALSEKQKIEMNKMLGIAATAADPKVVNTTDPYYFSAIPNSDYLGGSIAYYAAKDLGVKEVIIFIRDDAYGKSIYNPFKAIGEKNGLSIVKEYTYPVNAKDFTSYLSQGLKDHPNAYIMITGYAPDGGLIAKQARGLGYDKPILGNVSLTNKEYSDIAGEASDDLIVAATSNIAGEAPEGSMQKKFAEAWEAKHGERPDDYEVRGYDVVYLLKTAIENANSLEPEEVRKALLQIKDFDGASGMLSFNENGGIQKTLFIIKMKGATPELVKEINPQDL